MVNGYHQVCCRFSSTSTVEKCHLAMDLVGRDVVVKNFLFRGKDPKESIKELIKEAAMLERCN